MSICAAEVKAASGTTMATKRAYSRQAELQQGGQIALGVEGGCRQESRERDGRGLQLYCVAVETFGQVEPRAPGFDAAVQFPPHHVDLPPIQKPGIGADFQGVIYDYEEWSRNYLQPNANDPAYPLFRCVSPGWDNTARRGPPAMVFADSTPDKYARWLASTEGDCINIFPDYETFGEHHWPETGIHDFRNHFPEEILKWGNLQMATPSEVVKKHGSAGEIDVPEKGGTVSWADIERDSSGWLGNAMQWAYYNSLRRQAGYACKRCRAGFYWPDNVVWGDQYYLQRSGWRFNSERPDRAISMSVGT